MKRFNSVITTYSPDLPLSVPEREAIEKYINVSLAAGIIRPSSSSAGVGFFFVAKEDKTLSPERNTFTTSRLFCSGSLRTPSS